MSDDNKEPTKQDSITDLIVEGIKKIWIFGAVYFLGYYNFSLVWIVAPVALSVIRDRTKRKNAVRRDLFRAAAFHGEKEVVLATLRDLPAWVFFPDVERAEWLNKVIKQMWPNINSYAKDIITDIIEPSLKANMEHYKLKGFKFDRIILGSVPCRIGGVIVYDNVARDEIVMDLDINYAGDCDVNFHLVGLKGGLKNLQLYGRVRVVMKPLISSIPLAGGLQVFFMNNPQIDFDLVGIATILEIPGINELLKKIVLETISSMMVLPNKLFIKLSDEVDASQVNTSEPEGVLRIHVIEAKDLMKLDLLGKSDPYIILKAGAEEYKSRVIDSNVNPKWDEWCQFIINESNGQQLDIHLWDKDKTEDESLGRASLELGSFDKSGKTSDMWIDLEGVKHGKVHLRLTWLSLSDNYEDLQIALEETKILRVTCLSTAILTVFIDSATNLPQPKPSTKPDPYVVMQMGQQEHKTRPIQKTIHPVWEQGFTFSVSNPNSDSIYLRVIDQKTGNDIGEIYYNLSSLCMKPGLILKKQPFTLDKTDDRSKLVWSLKLYIVKNDHVLSSDNATDDRSRTESTHSSSPGNNNKKPFVKQESSFSLGSNVSGSFDNDVFDNIPASGSGSDESSTTNNQSSSGSASAEENIGVVYLTISYSSARQRLVVIVNRIERLAYKDPTNLPDAYVKLYLLPERNKDSKRKTAVVKNNCNPVYDEKFEYLISQSDLYGKQLEVTVTDQNLMSNKILGQVIIDLDQIDLKKPVVGKYDIEPL